jgi:4-hydroxy-tetrahydrodipicolinate reductase
MNDSRLRVVVWGTGNAGMAALRQVIRHPLLELVGVIVHSADKAGCDAGALGGLEPCGVTTTQDPDVALGAHPDCVVYCATADLRPMEARNDLIGVLERGINVVSTSIVALVYPPAAHPGVTAKLEAACERGNASCFTSGIDPGFANDLFPLALTGVCERIDSIRVLEILNYDTYDQATVLFDTMGFGKPLDHTPLLLFPGALTFAWGPVVHQLAAGCGVEVERIEEVVERRPSPRDLVGPVGTVAKGTMGALRFEVQGIVEGEARIVIEHVTRMADDLAPDWPQPPGHGGYRVIIDGSPRYVLELQMEGDDGDHNTAGIVATAARVVNAIPAVCAAPPGLLSTLDLPLITGTALMSTKRPFTKGPS